MYYFCTYFDINYLPRALCLLDSLSLFCPVFKIHMLCLDNNSFERICALENPHVVPVDVSELEAAAPDVVAVKPGRSRLEYYYTCGPAFIRYLLEREPQIDLITYLDSDMYFYSSPEPLFQALQGHSIGVVGHHMPEFRKNLRQGLYNVGWINFRKDNNGLACLDWWREKCIEWCYERFEDGKFADQLYLDHWPKLFKGFYEFTHHGANVAAWNVGDYHFSLKNGRVFVDKDPLIFYHFHGFKKISKKIYNTNLGLTLKFPNPILKGFVFAEYIEKLEQHSNELNPTSSIRKYQSKSFLIKFLARCIIGLIFRQYVIVIGKKVI